jgi:magnesium-transporting ATPase (P-type)
MIVFMFLIFGFLYAIFVTKEQELISTISLQRLIDNVTLVITLIIVAVPTGLPMVVTLGLAF